MTGLSRLGPAIPPSKNTPESISSSVLNLVTQQGAETDSDPYWDRVILCTGYNPNAYVIDTYGNKESVPVGHRFAGFNRQVYAENNDSLFTVQSVEGTQGTNRLLGHPNGYWSNRFTGASNQYINLPTGQANLAFGTNDFTVEFFMYVDYSALATPYIFTTSPATTTAELAVWFTSATNTLGVSVNNVNIISSATNAVFERNKWVHVAVCRTNGDTYYVYIDGVLLDSIATNSTSITTNTWRIGYRAAAANYFAGYLSNFRALNGTALYTGSSLTVPTQPFSGSVSNTAVLICNGFWTKDDSSNDYLVRFANAGTIAASVPFSPFDNDLSINKLGWQYFPYQSCLATITTTSYFTFPDTSGDAKRTITVGADFTIEGWLSSSVSSNAVGTYMLYDGLASAANTTVIAWLRSGFPEIQIGASAFTFNTVITTPTTGPANYTNWMHLAFVRQNGEITAYLNGRNAGTATSLATKGGAVGGLWGQARIPSGQSQVGFFSGIKVSDQALYTSDFDPLSAFVPGITDSTRYIVGTKNNAPLIDKSGRAVFVCPFASNSTSTTYTTEYTLFNEPVIYDQNTSATTLAWYFTQQATQFSTLFSAGAKSTLEMWFNYIYGNDYYGFFFSLSLYLHPESADPVNGTHTVRYGSVGSGTTLGTITHNEWHHFAWVNTGSSIDTYIDGTRTHTGLANLTVRTGSSLTLGSSGGGTARETRVLWGPIRLTAGIARYSGASFTVPTKNFPSKYGT